MKIIKIIKMILSWDFDTESVFLAEESTVSKPQSSASGEEHNQVDAPHSSLVYLNSFQKVKTIKTDLYWNILSRPFKTTALASLHQYSAMKPWDLILISPETFWSHLVHKVLLNKNP